MRVIRALVIVFVVAVAAFLLMGYVGGSRWPGVRGDGTPVGTTGAIDVERARERGAEIGEKAAAATQKVGAAMGEAALTSKIKAKMALDDNVKARAIDVSTNGSIVTLSGTVRSVAERERAVALARETNGITRVVDNLIIKPQGN